MLSTITIVCEMIFLAIIKPEDTMDVGNIISTVFILFFSFALLFDLNNGKHTNKYFSAIVLGYFFRIILLYYERFFNHIFELPQSMGDAIMFYNGARNIAMNGGVSHRGFFITLMGRLFNIIGVNQLYGQFLLMLLSVVALVVTIISIDSLSINEKIKNRISWILCLLPHFALVSSFFLRESLVMLMITIATAFSVRWMNGESIFNAIIGIVISLVACLFHSGSIGITIGILTCLLIFDNHNKKIHITSGGLLLSIILAFGASYIFLRYGDSLLGKFSNITSLEDLAKTSNNGGSSYAQYVGDSKNLFNMLIYSLPRITYFLFSPFPWQWRGIGDLVAFFFSGLYYLIVIYQVILFFHQGKHPYRGMVVNLIVMAFFCTFIFAWGTSNTGTASRHRDKMVCLYGLIYALSSSRINNNSNGIVKEKTETQFGRKYIK